MHPAIVPDSKNDPHIYLIFAFSKQDTGRRPAPTGSVEELCAAKGKKFVCRFAARHGLHCVKFAPAGVIKM